jgi:hypothetical protein
MKNINKDSSTVQINLNMNEAIQTSKHIIHHESSKYILDSKQSIDQGRAITRISNNSGDPLSSSPKRILKLEESMILEQNEG